MSYTDGARSLDTQVTDMGFDLFSWFRRTHSRPSKRDKEIMRVLAQPVSPEVGKTIRTDILEAVNRQRKSRGEAPMTMPEPS